MPGTIEIRALARRLLLDAGVAEQSAAGFLAVHPMRERLLRQARDLRRAAALLAPGVQPITAATAPSAAALLAASAARVANDDVLEAAALPPEGPLEPAALRQAMVTAELVASRRQGQAEGLTAPIETLRGVLAEIEAEARP